MAPGSTPFLVGVGASAGGVEGLLSLAEQLPSDFPAAVLVVVHQAAEAPTVLPALMDKRCALPVRHPTHQEPPRPGEVLLAPPDHHLLVASGRIEVVRGPRENGHRPAVDPLFRSIALEAGPAGLGCVLSGLLDDGASGLLEIVRHGGTAVVQDPDDALFDSMPRAALDQVPGAVVRPLSAMGATIAQLLARPVVGGHRPSHRLRREVEASRAAATVAEQEAPLGPPAGLACPDCAGPLFDLSEDGGLLHFRCRVGHAWTEQSLSHQQDDGIERALDVALQALLDKADLQHRVAAKASARGADRVAARARASAHDALGSARMIQDLLHGKEGGRTG